MKDIKTEIYHILQNIHDKEIVPEEEFTENLDLIEDVGLDSVEILTLLSEVEDAFGIRIDNINLLTADFWKLGQFCGLIEQEVRGRKDK